MRQTDKRGLYGSDFKQPTAAQPLHQYEAVSSGVPAYSKRGNSGVSDTHTGNIEVVLARSWPFMRADGGDIELLDVEEPLPGSCS